MDDGSCDYECVGCTDSEACNFDVTATIDSGECEYPDPVYGCDCESVITINTVKGSESSESGSVEGVGVLESLIIEMNWQDIATSASWPADLIVQIGTPNGDC